MQHFRFIAVLSLFVSIVSAAHTLKVVNYCSHNLYFWTIGPSMLGKQETNDFYTVVPGNGGSVIHDMEPYASVSIKIRDRPHYVPAPKGILQAEYWWEPDTSSIWYDFSAIDCGRFLGPDDPWWCPFLPGGVRMSVPDADTKLCPVAECQSGANCEDTYTYTKPGSWKGEPTLRCDHNYDVIFETCVAAYSPQTIAGPEDDDYNQSPSVDYHRPLPEDAYHPPPPSRPAHPGLLDSWNKVSISHPHQPDPPPPTPPIPNDDSSSPAHCRNARPQGT